MKNVLLFYESLWEMNNQRINSTLNINPINLMVFFLLSIFIRVETTGVHVCYAFFYVLCYTSIFNSSQDILYKRNKKTAKIEKNAFFPIHKYHRLNMFEKS